MKRGRRILLAVGIAGALASEALAEGGLSPLTFTSTQVAGGRVNYAAKCAKCHGPDLEGGAGPALVGEPLEPFFSGSVSDLSDFIQASMPQDAPGTLTPDETATLIAYLASKNERKPGTQPLPSDHAALTKMGFNQ